MTTRRPHRTTSDQPALDLDLDLGITPPAHPDEQVAREEISRFYDDRVADAHTACEAAMAALAAARQTIDAAEQARQVWRDHGQITPTDGHPAERRHPGLIAGTVLGIIGDAQDRYMAAARAALAPVFDAPTTTAAMAELGRLDHRPDTAALRQTADAAHERMEALCRWLTAQGHDLGAMARPAAQPRPRGRRRR